MKRKNIVLAFVVAALSAGAAEKARVLHVGGTADAPEIGVRSAGLRFAVPSPLPPPENHVVPDRNGGQVTVYSAHELWLATQLAGRWQSREGDVMMLARVTSVLPTAMVSKGIQREDLAKVIEQGGAADEANLQNWLGSFLGGALSSPLREVKPAPMRLAEVRAGESGGGMRFGYVFRFRPGAGAPTNEWFGVGFLLAPGTDPDASRKEIERDLLASIQAVPRAAKPGVASIGQGRTPAGPGAAAASQGTAGMTPKYAAARQAALDSIRGLKGWRVAETPHYVILTSLPSGKDVLVKELQRSLEFLREAYGRVVPPAQPIDEPGIVRMFGDAADYERYVDPTMRWTGGFWDPGRGELVLRPQEWGSMKQKSDWLRGVLFHEAFHQFLSQGFGRAEQAMWYNEGHAALMEGVEFANGAVRVDEVAEYTTYIDAELKKGALRFADLFPMTRAQFYASAPGDDPEANRKANYARSWAVCYYLRKGVPLEQNSPWAGMLDRYRKAVIETGDAQKATAACFEGVDMTAFETACLTFWSSSNRRGAAKKFDLFAARDAVRPAR